ncbi:MAG: hypothetical protein LBU40_00285 [Methanobrevibacter sp.]|jgi:hypothetical protein|nr:hypothetical protein [Methanobrevibacter sp.]
MVEADTKKNLGELKFSEIFIEKNNPNQSFGLEYDIYINNTSLEIFKKENGIWKTKGLVGEYNVNSDWNETDPESKKYIMNKPGIISEIMLDALEEELNVKIFNVEALAKDLGIVGFDYDATNRRLSIIRENNEKVGNITFPVCDGLKDGFISVNTYLQIYQNQQDITTKLPIGLVATTPNANNKVTTIADVRSIASQYAVGANFIPAPNSSAGDGTFNTKADLNNYTPTKPGYSVVKSDETHENNTVRYNSVLQSNNTTYAYIFGGIWTSRDTDDIINESDVTGINATDALNTLKNSIANSLTSLATVARSGNYNDLSNKPTSLPANGGNSATVNGFRFWAGIQDEYDELLSYQDDTFYYIVEDTYDN